MTTKFARIVIVVLANAIFFYFVFITIFLIVSTLMRLDPREGGLTMISPLAILIFLLVIPAVLVGIISGTLVNIFWDFATSCRRNLVKISILLGTGFSLLPTLLLAAAYASHDRSTGATLWPTLIGFPFIAMVGALSNFVTVVVVKKLLPNKRLP